MLYCSVSTAAVSYCHAHKHQTHCSMFVSVALIFTTRVRDRHRKTIDGYKSASAVYQRAASCGVTRQRSGWSSAASLSDCVLAEWLNRDGATRVQSRSPHWHKRLMYSFASPSGHKRAVDSRPESRQMPAILK